MKMLLVLIVSLVGCWFLPKPQKPSKVSKETCEVKTRIYHLSPEQKERLAAIKVKPIEAIVHKCPNGKHWELGSYIHDSAAFGEGEEITWTECRSKDGLTFASISNNGHWSFQYQSGTEHDYDYAYCATDKQKSVGGQMTPARRDE